MAEYVADADALRYILEANGFKVVKGDFTRRDGVKTRLAVIPVDPRPMMRAAIDALARWDGDDDDDLLPCETDGCRNKGVTWRGSYFLCDDHNDGTSTWDAECEEFGCHDTEADHSSRYERGSE